MITRTISRQNILRKYGDYDGLDSGTVPGEFNNSKSVYRWNGDAPGLPELFTEASLLDGASRFKVGLLWRKFPLALNLHA